MDNSHLAAPAPTSLVDWLHGSPDAVVQLVQRLKAASGMPQGDAARPAVSTAADASMRPAQPKAEPGIAQPASNRQAAAAAQATVPQAMGEPLLQPAGVHPAACQRLPGPGPSTSQMPQQEESSTPYAQVKQLLMRLLSQSPQQQQPQHQPSWCAAATEPHVLPSSQGQHTQPTAENQLSPVQQQQQPQHHQHQPQDQLVEHLRATLFDMLQSASQQQQQRADQPIVQQQCQDLKGGMPSYMHPACAPAVGTPALQPPPAEVGRAANAAALAAMLGLAVSGEQAGTGVSQTACPSTVQGSCIKAGAEVPVAGVATAHLLPGHVAPVGFQQQLQGSAAATLVEQPPQLATGQQHNAASMPLLIERLRAAVVNSTQGCNEGRSAEQQRLLGIVDQLQSAWVSIGSSGTTAGTNGVTAAATTGTAAAPGTANGKAGLDGCGDVADSHGLHVLLEALNAQLSAEGGAASAGAEEDAAAKAAAPVVDGVLPHGYNSYDNTGLMSSYDAQGYMQDGTTTWTDAYDDAVYDYEGCYQPQRQQQYKQGASRRKRSWATDGQQQLRHPQPAGVGNNLAAAIAAAMMREGGAAVDGELEPVTEQKWLLKPRGRGKRQVKPNKLALTGELPPVFDRWGGKVKRGDVAATAATAATAHVGSSDDDELWQPPRVRMSSKRRRAPSLAASDNDGGAGSDHSLDGQLGTAGDGAAGRASGSGGPRRGYGWQLLLQQQQQQQASGTPGDAEGAGGSGAVEAQGGCSHSDSGGAEGVATEGTGSDRGDAGDDGMDAVEGGVGGDEGAAAAAAAAGGAGGKAKGKPAARKERWVPPTEEWSTDDGVKVWPKDTQICPAARVFYVAYKWVEEHWPDKLDTPDNHITAHPIRFYLDGQDTEVELTAKLRLYRKAVHLVISPYSALSKKFVRKWLAGYGFDPEKQVLRAYLSTLKPKPPKVPQEDPVDEVADLSAAAAVAAEWCFGAAAAVAGGPIPLDAQQQLAAQLAALANMLQVKSAKQQQPSAPLPQLPLLPVPQLLQQPQAASEAPQPGAHASQQTDGQGGPEAGTDAGAGKAGSDHAGVDAAAAAATVTMAAGNQQPHGEQACADQQQVRQQAMPVPQSAPAAAFAEASTSQTAQPMDQRQVKVQGQEAQQHSASAPACLPTQLQLPLAASLPQLLAAASQPPVSMTLLPALASQQMALSAPQPMPMAVRLPSALQAQQQQQQQLVFVHQGTSASGQPLMVPMIVVSAATSSTPAPPTAMVTQH